MSRDHLQHEHLKEDNHISLKEHTLLIRLVIVLDDISLLSDEDDFVGLSSELGNALIVATNRVYPQLGAHFRHIVLPDLDLDAVQSLIKVARPLLSNDHQSLENLTYRIQELGGGNPLLIKLMADNLTNVDLYHPLVAEDKDNIVCRILLSSFDAVPFDSQSVFLLLSLLPGPITLELLRDYAKFWLEIDLTDRAVIELLSCGLIVKLQDSDCFALPDASKRFVQWLYNDSSNIQIRCSELVNALASSLAGGPQYLEIVEYTLQQAWLEMSEGQREGLCDALGE